MAGPAPGQLEFAPQPLWEAAAKDYFERALGKDNFARTSAALLRPPLSVCLRVNTLRASPDEVARRLPGELAAEDRQLLLDHGLAPFVHPGVPGVVMVPGTGPHPLPQQLQLQQHAPPSTCSSIDAAAAAVDGDSSRTAGNALPPPGPPPPPQQQQPLLREVVVSRKAAEAVLRGAHAFAPGVLACSHHLEAGDTVAVTTAMEAPGAQHCGFTRGAILDACGRVYLRPAAAARANAAAAAAAAGGNGGRCNGSATAAGGNGRRGGGSAVAASGEGRFDGSAATADAGGEGCCGTSANAVDTGGCAVLPSCGVAGKVMRGGSPSAGGASPAAVVGAAASGAAGVREGGAEERWAEEVDGVGVGGNNPRDRWRLCVGIGRAELGRTALFKTQRGVGVTMQFRVFRVPGCSGVLAGLAMLQNLPSVVAALALDPTPGSDVLDMCAAPGGKTAVLAQLMGDRGRLVALDRTVSKAAQVASRARELGLTCITAMRMDATKAVLRQPAAAEETAVEAGVRAFGQATCGPAPAAAAVAAAGPGGWPAAAAATGGGRVPAAGEAEAEAEETQEAAGGAADVAAAAAAVPGRGDEYGKAAARAARKAAGRVARGLPPDDSAPCSGDVVRSCKGFPPASFHFVLLDAPCSATGLRPRLQHQDASLANLMQAAAYQRKLIDAAVLLLRPGGRLVYSTCSIFPGENEANVRYLLDAHPSMRLVPHAPHIAGPGLTGGLSYPHPSRTQAAGGEVVVREQWLCPEEARLVQRFDPADERLDTIGFFVAAFQKQQQ